MDLQKIVQMRYIFSKISVHPAWNIENREAMADLFDLEEEDLDALNDFCVWVANHGLEYAWEAYKGEKF